MFIYCVRECISDNVCSLIKLHPFSAKVFLVAIVCPDFFKLMGLILIKGKVDDVSDHLCEHYIVLKDKCGQYLLCSKLRKKMLYAVNYR